MAVDVDVIEIEPPFLVPDTAALRLVHGLDRIRELLEKFAGGVIVGRRIILAEFHGQPPAW